MIGGGLPEGVGLRGRRSLRWKWGWRLSLSWRWSWSLGCQLLVLWAWGEAVHKSFIQPVHNSSVHKSAHNSLMTAVSGL